MTPATALGALCLALWIYLLCGRGFFWRGWHEPASLRLRATPAVVAVIPARNEAALIGATLRSLFAQDYPGEFRVIVVDDHSDDGTADRAREAAGGAAPRLTVVPAPALPPGWAGKVWAMHTGAAKAAEIAPAASYVLFTDADIVHGPDLLSRLVARAEDSGLDLTSLMVRLRCQSMAERALVPAFVYFFRMLYPFAWVNDRNAATAAAAGGCMLVRRSALERIGGLAAIRGELIDDCALAKAVKPGGPIRLDGSDSSVSARTYETPGDMWRLIARTAYTELRYSPLRLAAAVLGLTLVFLLPPTLALAAAGAAAVLGAASWAIMAATFVPALRYYGLSPAWAPCLPAIALFYLGATVDSARRHWLGRGGAWKGRAQGEVAD